MIKKQKYIISGGGTGGHIFPAIAIANAIKKRNPEADILFIGAKGKMEMEKVPAAGYPIEGLNIQGLQRKLCVQNLQFPFKLMNSLHNARNIIRKFKPDAVIGVGGYASGPTLRVASKKRIPCLIQEQNSYPGITNKLLAKRVHKICVAYPDMDRFFPKEKIILTGNPIREELCASSISKKQALAFFNFSDKKPMILVVGGSLGARSLNNSTLKGLEKLEKAGIQLLWQCGKYYFEGLKNQTEQSENYMLTAFINRMDMAYAAADIVISRAGALSISELSALGKASIFVPSPNVAEDHQKKNAMVLVNKKAAIMVEDKDAEEKLIDTAIQLINNKEEINTLETNIKELAFRNAADKIAEEIEKL